VEECVERYVARGETISVRLNLRQQAQQAAASEPLGTGSAPASNATAATSRVHYERGAGVKLGATKIAELLQNPAAARNRSYEDEAAVQAAVTISLSAAEAEREASLQNYELTVINGYTLSLRMPSGEERLLALSAAAAGVRFPREYLPLPNAQANVSRIHTTGTNTDPVQTQYARVRLDLRSLRIHTSDYEFATSTGSMAELRWQAVLFPMREVPFGVALGTSQAVGQSSSASIDLRGTPFGVMQQFAAFGSGDPQYSVSYGNRGQTVQIEAAGQMAGCAPAPQTNFFSGMISENALWELSRRSGRASTEDAARTEAALCSISKRLKLVLGCGDSIRVQFLPDAPMEAAHYSGGQALQFSPWNPTGTVAHNNDAGSIARQTADRRRELKPAHKRTPKPSHDSE